MRNIDKEYRERFNYQGFCIGDKVRDKEIDEVGYVVELRDNINGYYSVIVAYEDDFPIYSVRIDFKNPSEELEIINKCEVFPDIVLRNDPVELTFTDTLFIIEEIKEREIEKTNKKLTFFEAMVKLKDGYKVRSTKWNSYSYITIEANNEFIVNELGAVREINIEEYRDLLYFLEAYGDNWEVYEENN